MKSQAQKLAQKWFEQSFPKAGTRKISDLPQSCIHPSHMPPSHMVYEPGVWEHICAGCGSRTVFTVYGTGL